MFYYLCWRLSKNNKVKIRETIIFSFATISYLIFIYFLPNPYYALIIPIDILLSIYDWCNKYKYNYLNILDKDLHKNNDNQKYVEETIKSNNNNKNKCTKDEYKYNNLTLDFLDNLKVDKKEVNKGLNQEEIINNSNKIKYIPLKPDIQASLQQTVRNLGI